MAEFWRDLKPIEGVFKRDAAPEVYLDDAPSDDERFYAPLSETVGTRATSAGLVNRHYHPHEVFSYTISGK